MVMNILRRQGSVTPSPVITLLDQTLVDEVTDPADAYCAITFNTDGSVTVQADSGSHANWLQFGLASNYQIRADTTSGTLSVGTPGSWLEFPVTFAVSRTSEGSKVWVGTYQIRRKSDSVVLDGPEDLSLTATVAPGSSGTGGGGDGGSNFGNPPGAGSGGNGGMNEY